MKVSRSLLEKEILNSTKEYIGYIQRQPFWKKTKQLHQQDQLMFWCWSEQQEQFFKQDQYKGSIDFMQS